ncbi:hypothetical protein ACFU3J_04455 [Streptomyces sp. NPDC057411]|uniref:hypothetical protein n=1 Tax=unclassified Streptomyces TaxID=2593676 RepID=UPI00362ECABA
MTAGTIIRLVLPPCLLACLFLPLLAPAARAGGAGDGALAMSVTVNGASGAEARAVRAGAVVVKRYRLVNRGEADLYGVRIADPGVPGDLVRCPAKPLTALRSMLCTARFRALPGPHTATARATGSVPSLNKRLTATARSGYDGVAGALRLTEAVRVVARQAVVRYTVTNPGNRPLHAVRLSDPGLGAVPGGIDCGTDSPGTVPLLAPGASAGCTATVRRAPGTYRSTGLASGSDRVTTIGEGGTPVPAPELTARASAQFRLTAGTGPGAAGAGAGPAAAGAAGANGGPAVRGGAARSPGAGAGVAGAAGAPGVAGAPGGAAAGGAGGVVGGAPAGAGPAGGPAAAPGAAPGAAPPAVPPARPPGAVPRVSAPVPPALPTTPRPPAAAVADDEGLLARIHRRSRELPHLGVVLTLLFLLVPAAIAAAVFGSRPH